MSEPAEPNDETNTAGGVHPGADIPAHGCPRAIAPVARTSRDGAGRLVLNRWHDVVDVAEDPETFSNAVSSHLQIPNGLDGPEHRQFRELLDPYLARPALADLEPRLRGIADDVVASALGEGAGADGVADIGARYAVRAQIAWLGWPSDVADPLLAWVRFSRAAVRSGRRSATMQAAADFDAIIRGILTRTDRDGGSVTAHLLGATLPDGATLTGEQIVSILRNWTGGDLSSLALCAGVVLHALATNADLAQEWRRSSDAELEQAIEEVLRLDDPFVHNRRRATRPSTAGEESVKVGEVLVLDWREATRDPAVFAPGYDPGAHAADSLVFGRGPHFCPGRALTLIELRHLTRAVLAAGNVELVPGRTPEREAPPVEGWRTLPIRLNRAAGVTRGL